MRHRIRWSETGRKHGTRAAFGTPQAARRYSAWMNLPNAISLLRFPLAVAFVLRTGVAERAVLVILSAFSDWIDGVLARRRDTVTRTGELLDPIADRAFMVTALITLAAEGALPLWAVAMLLVRDGGVVVGAAVVLMLSPRLRLPARRGGKRVTWLQFGAVVLLLFSPSLALWIAPPIAALGVAALIDYYRTLRSRLREADGPTKG